MQHRGAQVRENGLNTTRLRSLDNTCKGKGPNGVNLDIAPQTAAYRSVIGLDADATRYARKSARALVKILRENGDREPSTKFLEGVFGSIYRVKPDRIKHAVDIVRKTINKDKETH